MNKSFVGANQIAGLGYLKGWFVTGALFAASAANAGNADVLEAYIARSGLGFLVTVTVEHNDEGWEHYADAWRVVTRDGKVLATRVLAHPHLYEQPFTRSLNDVYISQDVNQITIEAHDSVHGWGGKSVTLELAN